MPSSRTSSKSSRQRVVVAAALHLVHASAPLLDRRALFSIPVANMKKGLDDVRR